METENITEQEPTEISSKKERSAAYPARTIEESITLVAGIYKNFRNAFSKRDDILEIVEEVTHPRDIAAATYYLLLNREKDTYQVSDLFKTINSPLSEAERIAGLLKAFEAPKLYKELIEKFDGNEVPKELIIHLHRFHRITEDAAPLVADVFIKNAKYCGVLNEHNILNLKTPTPKAKIEDLTDFTLDPKEEFDFTSKEKEKPTNGVRNDFTQRQIEDVKQLEQMVNSEEKKIRLTGGKFAILKYPLNLSSKDIEIFKKEIELLELLVE